MGNFFASYKDYGIEMLSTSVFGGAPQVKDMDRKCSDIEHGHRCRYCSSEDDSEYVMCFR